MLGYEQLVMAADYIKSRICDVPDIAIVLGSGLGRLADEISSPICIDYADIPGFPRSTVAGHKGRFVYGEMSGRRVLFMQGRVHYYEGYRIDEVVMSVRVMAMLGIGVLLLTNASGGIADSLVPGDIMCINDHISSFVPSPLICPYHDKLGVRFPDMTHVYDEHLLELMEETYKAENVPFKKGVYIQVTGPQYETPAEIRAYRTLGADAVGMSTVCEAVAAKHMGMRIAGLSLVCNKAAGLGGELAHEDIVAAADRAAAVFERIVRGFTGRI